MQFLIIGRDGTDDEALNRRLAVREDHIALGDTMVADGTMWYGAALTTEDGKMCGSMLMMDFPSRQELDEWLAIEPYVVGKVWESIEIQTCNTRNPWQFNRDREFYESRKS
ncbi:MAG TPA: YciI family protein [Acidimicrobiia bacterium]|nr:YciI family protein [Acidimicrobiia bacterium]